MSMNNKAPEKIVLQEPTKIRTEKLYDNDIEYIRNDVFIEKACEWLENNASNYIIEHPFSSDVDFEEDKMIEDFKNYMKE